MEHQLKLTYKNSSNMETEILLPADDDELAYIIDNINICNNDVQSFEVELLNQEVEIGEYFTNANDSHICEWNLLASELNLLGDTEWTSYSYLVQVTLNEKNTSVSDLINLARNTLEETYIFMYCETPIELYERSVEYDKLIDFLPMLESIDDSLLDKEIIGKKIQQEQNGVFLGVGYIATDNFLKDLYDGHFLVIGEKQSQEELQMNM